tara:strand:+ start:4866 stop:5573 length:708 start_codon:yes stop_codon:yes gene_type:complete
MTKKLLIIIPVLNEVRNVHPLIGKIFKHVKTRKDVLFVDDNSKDGTRIEILATQKKYKNIFLIKRKKKLGIGSAHKQALLWGYKKKYEMIITMDGDGTHDPIYINKIIKILKTKKFSLVITNRFLNKDSMKDWTLWRKALTTLRHKLLKFLLNIKFDSSGALRGYLTKQIDMDDIFLAKNQSYSFFWESTFILSKKYKIKEISINLPGRLSGSSKMEMKDIFFAFAYLIKIYFCK